jgi:hypothetical protein
MAGPSKGRNTLCGYVENPVHFFTNSQYFFPDPFDRIDSQLG